MQLEDEMSLALRQLGHHLTATTSHLFRNKPPAELLPGHLQGIHPLLLQEDAPKPLAPGLLEREALGQVRVLHILVESFIDNLHFELSACGWLSCQGNCCCCTLSTIYRSTGFMMCMRSWTGSSGTAGRLYHNT
jgi:hypothetical protein